jgi:hypothetical protein
MNKLINLSMLTVVMLTSACATPTVVEREKVSDYQLSCSQIEQQVSEAESFRQKAEAEKGATGKNIAAVLLFWPAALATYHNVGEATKAADDRKMHLMGIYTSKNCTSGRGRL